MNASLIEVRTAGETGIMMLNRPQEGNCLSIAAWKAIGTALADFENGGAVRAVLIGAEGKHFCTGADLAEVKRVVQDPADLAHFLAVGHDTLCAIEASPLPVVVAIQGLCLAGGLELMLACDIAIAGAKARFGDQHSQFGLLPGWGGSQRLTRAIGLRRAGDLFLSARWIDADVAERWGLVNMVVPDDAVMAEAMAYCGRLASRSRAGLAATKRLARQGLEGTLAEGLALEREMAPAVLTGPDAAEGLAAFEAKRTPAFGGRSG